MTPEEVLGLQSWHLLLPTRHVHCPPNHFFLDTALIMWYRVSWVPLIWWINLNTKQNSIYHDCKILFEALFHEQPGTMADIAMPTLVNLIRSVQRHTINCMMSRAHSIRRLLCSAAIWLVLVPRLSWRLWQCLHTEQSRSSRIHPHLAVGYVCLTPPCLHAHWKMFNAISIEFCLYLNAVATFTQTSTFFDLFSCNWHTYTRVLIRCICVLTTCSNKAVAVCLLWSCINT